MKQIDWSNKDKIRKPSEIENKYTSRMSKGKNSNQKNEGEREKHTSDIKYVKSPKVIRSIYSAIQAKQTNFLDIYIKNYIIKRSANSSIIN